MLLPLYVIDATRRNPLTSGATLADVEAELKIWLRGAPDRNGGRSERAKRAQEKKAASARSRSPLSRKETGRIAGLSRRRSSSRRRSMSRHRSMSRRRSSSRHRSSCSVLSDVADNRRSRSPNEDRRLLRCQTDYGHLSGSSRRCQPVNGSRSVSPSSIDNGGSSRRQSVDEVHRFSRHQLIDDGGSSNRKSVDGS